MERISSGLSYVDVGFQNVPRIVAAGVVHGDGGVALIDPGPTSTLPTLEAQLIAAGIGIEDVIVVLLTHIHLDHAGGTGTLIARNPRIAVYVQETGAQHLVNPEKLLASLTRLLSGEGTERIWGEVQPVPPSSIRPLSGGEDIEAGGRRFNVAYTPGHASHHVSYFDRGSGVAFVGDVAGMQLTPGGYLLPPTPPPDIDLELWRASLARVAQWGPERLFLTHFGPAVDVGKHLGEVANNLDVAGRLVLASLERDGNDADREAWYIDEVRRTLLQSMSENEVRAYDTAGRLDWNWRGLARYFRKQQTR